MENKKLDEKIKIVVGEILGRADPVSKKVLTAFDPSKDAPANQRLLKKFSRNELDIFAEFLKIPLINIQTKEKLFSNRDKLTKRIILEITALYPTTCDECSQEYCVTSDKIPLVRCYICLQGSHDCEDITARIESMRSSSSLPLGTVWLCSGCRVANNPFPAPDSSVKPESAPPTTAPTTTTSTNMATPDIIPEQSPQVSGISQAELAAKLALIKEQQETEESKPNKCKTVCPKLAEGKCPHGVSGKTPSNGKEHCENYHPKRCRNFMSYATHKKFGCSKGDDCTYYHPQHCKSSLRNKTCFNESCTAVHVNGTRRTKDNQPSSNSKTDRSKTKTGSKKSKNSESQSRPTYRRDEIPTATERNTSNTKSSEDHFLEIRSLLQGMQDKFQKEIETLKVDITLQRSLLEHYQANQLLPHRPPSPKLSYHSQHVPPATFPPLDHYNLQRQFYPHVPSQNPMLVPQVQQNQVNWAPIPQASC